MGVSCPDCGSVRSDPLTDCPLCAAKASRRHGEAVRTTDLEPYTTLRYIGVLFRVLAGLVTFTLLGQAVLGVMLEGPGSLVRLLGAAMRLVALAGLLWVGGDIVRLMIGAGHDLRKARILLGRIDAALDRDPTLSRGGTHAS